MRNPCLLELVRLSLIPPPRVSQELSDDDRILTQAVFTFPLNYLGENPDLLKYCKGDARRGFTSTTTLAASPLTNASISVLSGGLKFTMKAAAHVRAVCEIMALSEFQVVMSAIAISSKNKSPLELCEPGGAPMSDEISYRLFRWVLDKSMNFVFVNEAAMLVRVASFEVVYACQSNYSITRPRFVKRYVRPL